MMKTAAVAERRRWIKSVTLIHMVLSAVTACVAAVAAASVITVVVVVAAVVVATNSKLYSLPLSVLLLCNTSPFNTRAENIFHNECSPLQPISPRHSVRAYVSYETHTVRFHSLSVSIHKIHIYLLCVPHTVFNSIEFFFRTFESIDEHICWFCFSFKVGHIFSSLFPFPFLCAQVFEYLRKIKDISVEICLLSFAIANNCSNEKYTIENMHFGMS